MPRANKALTPYISGRKYSDIQPSIHAAAVGDMVS